MTPIGCTVTPLEQGEVEAILGAIIDRTGAVPEPRGLRWLLATCHDGVAWGVVREGSSALSSEAFPEVSPVPERTSLLELRLFGPAAEVRLWRTGEGFAGCRIEDAPDPALDGSPGAPKRESWLLVGDLVREVRDGFSLLSGTAGKRQAVPVEVDERRQTQELPLRLEVCHHLEEDEESGAVRVVLTRFTGLVQGSRGDTR